MLKIVCLLIILLPVSAHAVTATVTNTFLSGQKIVASQVNQNFSDILSAINGQLADENIQPKSLTSASISNRTITWPLMASGTANSPFTRNYRKGCSLAYNTTNTVYIQTPCEITLDGAFGVITASNTVTTLSTLENVSAVATPSSVYYVYAQPTTTGNIQFGVSNQATPTVITARHPTNNNYKYIGSFLTKERIGGTGGESRINPFVQNSNTYLIASASTISDSTTLTTYPINYFVSVPPFSKSVYWRPTYNMSGTSAFQFFYTPTVAGAGFGQYNYFKESVFGGFERYNTETTKLLFDNGYVSAAYYANVSNTTSVKLLIYGYEEPQELY